MRKLKPYSIYIFIAFIFFSCANQSMDKNDNLTATMVETEQEMKPIEDVMELEKTETIEQFSLSKEQREAFELRGIQKFQDFIDYIKIISDKKVATPLKEHSLKLAMELFVNDSTMLTDSLLTDTNTSITVKSFLTKIKSNKRPITIKVNSIRFSMPIEADSLMNYKGNIEAILSFHGKKTSKNISVLLVNVKKDFGSIDKEITEIRLGNIEYAYEH